MTKTKITVLILVMFAASFIGRVGGILLERHVITLSGEVGETQYAAVCLTSPAVNKREPQP